MSRAQRIAAVLVVAGVAAGALAVAYYRVFSQFQSYDDEGYLLSSLRSFVDGGALYDEVYTQYGPAYYLVFGGLYRILGAAPATDSGRLITVAIWCVVPLVLAWASWLATRRVAVAALGGLTAFGTLVLLVPEPMHPVGLTTVLLAALSAAVVLVPSRPRAGFAAIGVLVALLALTKINIGVFAVLGLLLGLIVADQDVMPRRLVRAVVALLVVAPVLLLLPDLGDRGPFNVALVVLTGVAAALIVGVEVPRSVPGRPLRGPMLRYGVSAFAGVAAATLVVTLALGSSLDELYQGLVVEPSRLREVFTLAFSVPDALPWWSAATIVAALAVRRDRGVRLLDGVRGAGVRAAAGLLLLLATAQVSPLAVGPTAGAIPVGAFLLWITLVPPAHLTITRAEAFARAALVGIGLLEILQIYPVAGTQVRAASILFVVPATVMLNDAWAVLDHARATARPGPDHLAAAVRNASVAAAAAMALAVVVQPLLQARADWKGLTQLRTPGSTRLHLPAERAAGYADLTSTVRRECENLVTLPGFNSLHLWSGVRPPTDLNAGDWMFLLDEKKQQRVVDALERRSNVCLVRNQKQLDAWAQGRPLPDRPLLRYVSARFVRPRAFLGGEYELLVRDDRPTRR